MEFTVCLVQWLVVFGGLWWFWSLDFFTSPVITLQRIVADRQVGRPILRQVNMWTDRQAYCKRWNQRYYMNLSWRQTASCLTSVYDFCRRNSFSRRISRCGLKFLILKKCGGTSAYNLSSETSVIEMPCLILGRTLSRQFRRKSRRETPPVWHPTSLASRVGPVGPYTVLRATLVNTGNGHFQPFAEQIPLNLLKPKIGKVVYVSVVTKNTKFHQDCFRYYGFPYKWSCRLRYL